jgi:nicotinamide mononucleotide transporter
VALGGLAWVALVPVLERLNSSMPRLDAFTTVFSVVATWWMVQWDPINWLHWIVIDAVSICLYMKRGMPWGALLFAVYTALAVHGWLDAVSLA